MRREGEEGPSARGFNCKWENPSHYYSFLLIGYLVISFAVLILSIIRQLLYDFLGGDMSQHLFFSDRAPRSDQRNDSMYVEPSQLVVLHTQHQCGIAYKNMGDSKAPSSQKS